jgi:DNA-binding protein HU-beta
MATRKYLDSLTLIAYSFPSHHVTQKKDNNRGEEQLMAKVLTKAQVVAHLADKTGLQKKETAAVLEQLATLATKEVKGGGQFVVPGLGKAVKAHRKARVGRNPQTGQPINIPAKTVVKFRLAKAFKDAVVPPKKK